MLTISLIRPKTAAGLSLWLLLFVSGYSFADEVRGRVVSVADGDTLTVLDASNRQHRVRLNGIDAPETRQAFSQGGWGSVLRNEGIYRGPALPAHATDEHHDVGFDVLDRHGADLSTILVVTPKGRGRR